MKANSVGGMLLWGIKSYYTSPYAYYYHFRDYAKNPLMVTTVDKTNSKVYALVRFQFIISPFLINVHSLCLWETDSKEYMGTELETAIHYTYNNMRISIKGGVFLPTSYYKTRSVTNLSLPNGSDPFYAIIVSIGYILSFDKDTIPLSIEDWSSQQNSLDF